MLEVRDVMHPSVERYPEPLVRGIVARERQPHRALHDALEDGLRGRIVGYRGMRQPGVALALADQRQLGLEQQTRKWQETDPQGRLVVVGEIPPDAEQMIERYLEVVFVPIREIRDAGVEQHPRQGRGPKTSFGADSQPVARGLLVLRGRAVDLDVVEQELAKHGRGAVALEVQPQKVVGARVGVELLDIADIENVQIPRLEVAVPARDHCSLPHCKRPASVRPQPHAMLHHVAMHRSARRVGVVVELGGDRLQLKPGCAERQREMIEPVWVVG